MKKIKFPEKVAQIELPDGRCLDITFDKWIETLIDASEESGKGVANIKKAVGLLNIVEEAANDDKVILLENNDYDFLKKALNAPLKPAPARKCFKAGYYDAIENAEDFTPSKD